MENIARKIKALDYTEEMMTTLPKFLATLVAKDPTTGEDLVSEEEIIQTVKYLKEKGISLRPTHLKVLAMGFSYIKNAVEEMEKIGELKMYVDDPTRMIPKDNVNRILYLRKAGKEYKSPEGKYAKFAYSKRAFEAEFGVIDFTSEKAKEVNAAEPKNTAIKDAKEEKPKNQAEKTGKNSEGNKGKDKKKGSSPKSDSDAKQATDEVAINKDESMEYTGVLDLDNLTASFNGKKDGNNKKKASTANGPYDEILGSPQLTALTDETFERFENLASSIRRILTTVYNITEVSESISDNLVKLIVAEVPSDSDILYYAITYGKNISEEEDAQLRGAIEEELEYIKIFDLDTDNQRRAA